LVDAEAILQQLLAKLNYERLHIDRFVVDLFEAEKTNHVHVASYLLSQGIPPNVDLFVHATEANSYEMLQVFLDHGFDINEPTGNTDPPPLM
jgi:hypothetical protein